jgi:hypothetical protein
MFISDSSAEGAEAAESSYGDFGLSNQALNNASGELLPGVEVAEPEFLNSRGLFSLHPAAILPSCELHLPPGAVFGSTKRHFRPAARRQKLASLVFPSNSMGTSPTLTS